jgi:hypothetical protein
MNWGAREKRNGAGLPFAAVRYFLQASFLRKYNATSGLNYLFGDVSNDPAGGPQVHGAEKFLRCFAGISHGLVDLARHQWLD